MVDLITENLDLWSSAYIAKKTAGRGSSTRSDAYGIQKLRELILELAVQGKLVPQDPSDVPASRLLEIMGKEKERLIQEKIIRSSKKLSPITPNEIPFALPKGWQYVRLNDIGDWGAGATPTRGVMKYYGGDIPWFKSGELVGDYISESEEYVTELALKEISLRYNKKGDVLIAMYGATIGKTSILEVPATTNQAVCACTPFQGLENSYLLLLLKAYKNRFIAMGAGGAQPNISREKIIATVIALPPKEEQHRIIAKVQELMALCDRLEEEQSESIAAHQTLVEVLLNTLTSAKDGEDFQQSWERIAEHFDILFTIEQSIETLKQTILQLAVMGKLVPQDHNEEPATVLLEKIAQEKERLVKEGKIKKQNKLSEIADDKKLFELPYGWTWGIMPQVVDYNKYAIKRGPFGSAIKKDFFVSAGYKVYEQQHAINDDFSLGEYYIDQQKFDELSAFEVRPNDIIISCSGTIGKVAIAPEWMEPGIINQALLKLSLNENALTNAYFKILFPAYFMNTNTLTDLQGTAQKNMVSVDTLKQEPFPLPPLQEQKRIVAKVDELMSLCDALKQRIEEARTTQIHLADAIVEQAVK